MGYLEDCLQQATNKFNNCSSTRERLVMELDLNSGKIPTDTQKWELYTYNNDEMNEAHMVMISLQDTIYIREARTIRLTKTVS